MSHSPLTRWIDAALAIAYPEQCQLCEQYSAAVTQGYVCRSCHKSLRPTKPPLCQKCGLPVNANPQPNAPCLNCRDADWEFNQVRAAFTAQGPMREIIHRYKYDQHEFFESILKQCCLQATLPSPTTYTALIPIPLHPIKERERGFNQADRMSAFFAELFDIPINAGLLKRVRFTETQTHLSRSQRLRNLRGAFVCSNSTHQGRFLLIDDVMTTGATANAAAHALKKAGAQQVDVLTLARALPF